MSGEYSIIKISTKKLKLYGCDYVNDCRKMFFENVYKENQGVILVVVENQEDDDGKACKFERDCFHSMKFFFDELYSSVRDKDVPKDKTII